MQNAPEMKKTGTIAVDPEQYKALLEYSQQSGLTVHEIVVKAFTEWIKASEGEAAQI